MPSPNRIFLLSAVLELFLLLTQTMAQQPQDLGKPLKYPITRKVADIEEFHGIKVADPYRWLENLDSEDTRAWIQSQNQLTFAYLGDIPARARIKERLTKLWNYEKYSVFKAGGRYFQFKNTGLQNQDVLYTMKTLEGEPQLLLDPNLLSSDGTVALSGLGISDDGKLMAYSLSTAGSDWMEWHVQDIESRKDLPDKIRWVKFSGASWTHDNKGFFYSGYDEPGDAEKMSGVNYHQKLYFHRLGTAQAQDTLIYERADQKDWLFDGSVTEDGRYLIITISQGTDVRNRLYYVDLGNRNSQVIRLLDDFDASYTFIHNDGPIFWFRTDREAPRGRIIQVDTRKPERHNWKVLVPEESALLESVNVVNDLFVASYLRDAHTQVKTYDTAGQFVREIALPGIGTATGFSGKRADKETFYDFSSFTTPTRVYRYDFTTAQSTLLRQPRVVFRSEDYETKQIFYSSKDGTRVPMFISHRRGLQFDGKNPTLLYGYGGFNISITPGFGAGNLLWMEMGGVLAIPNLRGGGEYGEEWHQAGMKSKKQNVFDDFIAAAEWLVANKVTSTSRLAISGGSNGGLLVGAVLTERPDLFGAVLPDVGVMDMLRFAKFTIGWTWTSEYGSPENPDQFKFIYAYSPLHNIKPGTVYPATFITTADHDDRVWPGHSFKFAATLQAAQAGPAPILIRIETKAGHGAGKPTEKRIDEIADSWSFLSRVLNIPFPSEPQN
jgi:prolyl oligopeptidase